jgi:peptide deformylase
MAVLDIVIYPDERLHATAEAVAEVEASTRRLVDDMAQTMYAASGMGLAANQVGVLKRVVVIDTGYLRGDTELLVLVNPEIVARAGTVISEEGCLSLPGVRGDVERHARVNVRGLDRDGHPFALEAQGLLSMALQHEIDHLNGVLIIDRTGPAQNVDNPQVTTTRQ